MLPCCPVAAVAAARYDAEMEMRREVAANAKKEKTQLATKKNFERLQQNVRASELKEQRSLDHDADVADRESDFHAVEDARKSNPNKEKRNSYAILAGDMNQFASNMRN